MAKQKQYWLMKSEPDAFSIEDLERAGQDTWDGIRNYQARNLMRDEMRVGDEVLFYHSNAKPTGVAGIARVCREAYPDHTAWDPESAYFDPKASTENPVWCMVDIEFVEKFPAVLSRPEMQSEAALEEMMVLRRGMRLSIQPVTGREFKTVVRLGRRKRASTESTGRSK